MNFKKFLMYFNLLSNYLNISNNLTASETPLINESLIEMEKTDNSKCEKFKECCLKYKKKCLLTTLILLICGSFIGAISYSIYICIDNTNNSYCNIEVPLY
jgi:hypothetical protein